jgi:hypothetical protein
MLSSYPVYFSWVGEPYLPEVSAFMELQQHLDVKKGYFLANENYV